MFKIIHKLLPRCIEQETCDKNIQANVHDEYIDRYVTLQRKQNNVLDFGKHCQKKILFVQPFMPPLEEIPFSTTSIHESLYSSSIYNHSLSGYTTTDNNINDIFLSESELKCDCKICSNFNKKTFSTQYCSVNIAQKPRKTDSQNHKGIALKRIEEKLVCILDKIKSIEQHVNERKKEKKKMRNLETKTIETQCSTNDVRCKNPLRSAKLFNRSCPNVEKVKKYNTMHKIISSIISKKISCNSIKPQEISLHISQEEQEISYSILKKPNKSYGKDTRVNFQEGSAAKISDVLSQTKNNIKQEDPKLEDKKEVVEEEKKCKILEPLQIREEIKSPSPSKILNDHQERKLLNNLGHRKKKIFLSPYIFEKRIFRNIDDLEKIKYRRQRRKLFGNEIFTSEDEDKEEKGKQICLQRSQI